MSAFDWRDVADEAGLPFVERYPVRVGDFPTRGRAAWMDLVRRLVALSTSVGSLFDESEDVWEVAFDEFLARADAEPRVPRRQISCCVFVSHRRADVDPAERIAYLSAQHGMRYWLDVHDPALHWANAQGITSPGKEILVASMIEMGLLNSTHVVSCHTRNSAGSSWIPYEIGRVKQRRLFATRACAWFDPSGPMAAGEYTYLMARRDSDTGMDRWLAKQAASGSCRKRPPYWPKPGIPSPLPAPPDLAP